MNGNAPSQVPLYLGNAEIRFSFFCEVKIELRQGRVPGQLNPGARHIWTHALQRKARNNIIPIVFWPQRSSNPFPSVRVLIWFEHSVLLSRKSSQSNPTLLPNCQHSLTSVFLQLEFYCTRICLAGLIPC